MGTADGRKRERRGKDVKSDIVPFKAHKGATPPLYDMKD